MTLIFGWCLVYSLHSYWRGQTLWFYIKRTPREASEILYYLRINRTACSCYTNHFKKCKVSIEYPSDENSTARLLYQFFYTVGTEYFILQIDYFNKFSIQLGQEWDHFYFQCVVFKKDAVNIYKSTLRSVTSWTTPWDLQNLIGK